MHVWVHQLASGAFGKKTVLREGSSRRRLFDLVAAIIEDVSGERVGIITFKDAIPELTDYLQKRIGDNGVVYSNYWGLRGLNKMKECRHIILLGTPMMNIQQLLTSASALYWDQEPLDASALDSWEWLGTKHAGEIEVWVKRFADPRLRKLAWQVREAEIIQAVGRIRPLDEPSDKVIWLLSNIPIPGFDARMIFESIEELRAYVTSGKQVPKEETLGTKIARYIEAELKAGNDEPTRRSLMAKFGASEATVKRARRDVRDRAASKR